MQKIKSARHADVSDRLIQDFLDLDWRDANVERRSDHDLVFIHRLTADDRGQDQHDACSGVELASCNNLAKGEVVEDLDQLGVADRELRLVIRKQLLGVFVGGVCDDHCYSPVL